MLRGKKNRIILRRKGFKMADPMFRSVLNGVLVQDRDNVVPTAKEMEKSVTSTKITKAQAEDHLKQYVGLTELGSDTIKAHADSVVEVTGASVSSGAIHKAVYCALEQFKAMGGVK